jgi:hypothetical protein
MSYECRACGHPHPTETRCVEPPLCPLCGDDMRKRTNKRDGSEFWGCSMYPQCDGTRRGESEPAKVARGSYPEWTRGS